MSFFRSNLRTIRKKLSVNQEELGNHVKVRSTSISNWENGVSMPDVEQLVSICQFFGVSVDFFLFRNFDDGAIITEEFIENFKKDRPKGKTKTVDKPYGLNTENASFNTVHEPDSTLMWAMLQTLRSMDAKLDQLKAGVDSISKVKTL